MLSEYHDLLDRLDGFRDVEAQTKLVEFEFDDGSALYGEIDHYYPTIGLMHFSASKSIKSRSLISLWLNHLVLCGAGLLGRQETSQLFAPSTRGWRFNWIELAQRAVC